MTVDEARSELRNLLDVSFCVSRHAWRHTYDDFAVEDRDMYAIWIDTPKKVGTRFESEDGSLDGAMFEFRKWHASKALLNEFAKNGVAVLAEVWDRR